MKKIVFSILMLSGLMLSAQKTNVMLDYKGYCTEDHQPYVEFQFVVDGRSVNYVANEEGKFGAEVDVRVEIALGDSLVKQVHFILTSEEFADTVRSRKPDFATTKNVPLPNGEYVLHFYVKDLHNEEAKQIEYIDNVTLYFPEDKVSSSEITLLRELRGEDESGTFVKYGYAMTPLYFDYVPETMPVLPYMMEIYNTEKVLGKDESFLVRTYVELYESGLLGNAQQVRYMKKKTAPVVVLLNQMDVFKLYSGNYNAVVEILDLDSNVLVTAKSFFQRSNPAVALALEDYDDVKVESTFADRIKDTVLLQEYVASLYPISSTVERDFYNKRMKKIPYDRLKRFFYSFWLKRNAQDPEGEWLRYKAKVDYVNKVYGSKVVKGYRTDRGRIYLQYGPPSQIIEEPYDPQSYPYEVWQYYVLGSQTNVKFVFYTVDIVTNDYELLHSDAIGETHNPRWQMELTKRLNPTYDPDVTTPMEYWGGEINNNWRLNR